MGKILTRGPVGRPCVVCWAYRRASECARYGQNPHRGPVGRPCVVCASIHRLAVEGCADRGSAVNLIGREIEISPSSIRRHLANHPCLPPPQLVGPAPKSNGRAPRAAAPAAATTTHFPTSAILWWTPTEPGPQRGDRCTACGRKDDNWWYWPGAHGGCDCWTPAFDGVNKLRFSPRIATEAAPATPVEPVVVRPRGDRRGASWTAAREAGQQRSTLDKVNELKGWKPLYSV